MFLGIIGNGFVGTAIYENLKNNYNFLIYDRKPEKANCNNVKQVTAGTKIIFIALPTPMQIDGSCDLSIIFESMDEIYEHYNDNIIIIKSTVSPGTCEKIANKYPGMRIVFSPEFLTEANYIQDFKNCNRMIFGGNSADAEECIRLMQVVFPDKHYFITDWKTAEIVKYFINTFLATKVSFANEMKQICDATGTDYDGVVNLALYDKRIGKSHLQVPGPDGYRGFGGKCFAKDLNALISFFLSNDIKPVVLKAAWEKNLEVREKQDWLDIEGAISKRSKDEY